MQEKERVGRRSDSRAVARAGALEISIERGACDAHEGTTGLGYRQAIPVQRSETVLDEFAEFGQSFGENLGRRAAPGRDLAEIDRQVAHQALDDFAAQSIVMRQFDAARCRELSGRDGGAPFGRFRRVLNVAGRQSSDRRSAETKQSPSVVNRIALEVAPDCARG